MKEIKTKKIKAFLKTNKRALISLTLTLLVLVTGKKIHTYTSAPTQPKDCDFVYPSSVDQTKPTTLSIKPTVSEINYQQQGGTINDASCLNKTAVYGIVNITSEQDIKNALQFAQENKIKITPAGQRHTMGGQTFTQNGLVLDMRQFNHIKLNKEQKVVNIQTGATWKQLQELLDKEGLSVIAMQSINIFTVGGTLSVNAHGIAHDPGQVAPTVKSMRIMLSSGEIKTASPTQNSELFKSALGGYGLMGVILDVDLQVQDNELYAYKTATMDYKEFPKYYQQSIENNKNLGLFYGRISVSPSSYLTETVIHTYEKTSHSEALPPMKTQQKDSIQRFVINFSKTGSFGRWLRWKLEKVGDSKLLHTCITRNDAMSQPDEVCDVARNQEMYDAMGYLKNKLPDTDILQEYFIPPNKMPEFIDGLREAVKKNKANLLNVTIRIVHKDTVTSLAYAPEDRFAFVLYFNQKFNEKQSKILQKTTTELIDIATNLGGAYYLPYQLYYSQDQLKKAYPQIDTFFATKKKYDPLALFSNKWYEKYGK
jgi:FAD/FMN-containing dehydrogenase